MKFDINKEFSFSQIADFVKNKFNILKSVIKKLDSNSIRNIKVNGKVIRINSIRLGFLVAIFAVLVALFVNLVVVPNTTYRAYSDLEFDTGGQYTQYPFGNNTLLLNKNGLRTVDNKSNDKWSVPMTLTSPTVNIGGNYALLADLDGNNSLNLFDIDGKNLKSFEIGTDILSAKTNKNGDVVVALSKEGYKGSVLLYNRKGKELFSWNSGEGYIIDVDIDNNGKYVAIAQLMSDGDETYSKIHILNVLNGQETATVVCEKSLVAKVNFNKNGLLTAITQNKVYGISKKGNINYEIDLAGKSPVKYDIENGDNFLFLCQDSRGNSALEIYSNYGKFLGSYISGDEIKNICCYKDTIIAATSRNIVSLNQKGKIKKVIEISHDIMNIGIYGNNRNVLILGGNKADIVRIR